MGQANRAPKSKHRRRFFVSDKAVLAARKLIPDLLHRDDEDVRNLIDEATDLAHSTGHRRLFKYRNKMQDAVDLDHSVFAGENIVAVVDKNNHEHSHWELAILSIVPKSHVAKMDAGESVGSGMLADKLKNVAVKAPTAPAAAPITPITKPKEKDRPPMSGPPVETWIISYRDDGDELFDRVAAGDVQKFVGDLVMRGIDSDTIEVYRPVKKKTRVVVEFDV